MNKQPTPSERLQAVTTELYYEHFALAEDLAREVMENLGAFEPDAARVFLLCASRTPVAEALAKDSEIFRLVEHIKEHGPDEALWD